MQLLRQGTASNLSIGTIVAADGVTPDTSRTVTNITQLSVLKEGSAGLTSIIANVFTHLANGVYKVGLTVADTNTLGKLDLFFSATTCQPKTREFMVVPPNIYDSMVNGTDELDVNIDQINGVTDVAPVLAKSVAGAIPFTVQAGASVNIVTTDLSIAVNDHYNGRTVTFISGALKGQSAEITNYDGATKQLTVSTLTSAPANGTQAIIV